MKVREALVRAASRLAPGNATPRLDAELLMAQAMGIEREALLLSRQEEDAPASFDRLVDRRVAGEPLAYISGRRAFWTIELAVGPAVLIPRPDSETLIEAALDRFSGDDPSSVLDLGTGSGALLLAALDQWPEARGLGIDKSAQALAMASANAQRLGFADRTIWRLGDWSEGVDDQFDLVLCNPPYVADNAALPRDVVEWEPHEALFAGPDGMAAYRRLAPMLPHLLSETGIGCVEIGLGQETKVTELFEQQGLTVASRRDMAGHVRCLILSV